MEKKRGGVEVSQGEGLQLNGLIITLCASSGL